MQGWRIGVFGAALAVAAAAAPVWGDGLVGARQAEALRSSLVGRWRAEIDRRRVDLEFTADGRYSLDGARGAFEVAGEKLRLRGEANEVVYQVKLEKGQLTLADGDLAAPLTFSRARGAGGFLGGLFGISRESALATLYRILIIIAVVVVVRVTLYVLRLGSHFVIYSEWGPLRLMYRRRKNRAMTIHSLALNVLKYVIYVIALGFVLTELGINYTAYLASLSVIGLAIGFGSQGLVQDMVTGFFIIFEGQFDVGDMVEIGGQSGVVDQLGPRMTRLRNYAGQLVTIPNRNISVVSNYFKGAQVARVDVAVADEAAAAKAVGLLESLGVEIARQYEDAIVSAPQVEGQITLETGEHFVRLRLEIWPKEQWVVDQQLLPRIRECFKAAGLEIPADRVSVFYHAREQLAAGPDWRAALKKITDRIPRRRTE